MSYEILTVIFFTIFGLVLASFGNMLVFRLKHGESLLTRSHCEHCKHALSAFDLVPIFSYILLKGRCRYCKKQISAREVIGEALFACVAVAWGYLLALGNISYFEATIYMLFTLSIFVIALSDAMYLELPDEIQVVLAILGVLNIFTHGDILWNLFNVGFAAGLLLFTFLITGDKKMGFGDVKLALGLGFFLNYFYFTLAILTSSVAGIVFAVTITKGNREDLMKYRVPFGSFLSIAALVILLVLLAKGCNPLVFEGLFC